MTDTNETNEIEIGEDLVFTKTTPRKSVSGKWMEGRTNGHKFSALVFAEHAECPSYELGDSKISKLWIQRLADHETVLNFDRGWDIRPKTKIAQDIMDFLAAGLSDHAFMA
jgi:hypothetical protein